MSWCVREDFWPGDEILHVEFQGDTKNEIGTKLGDGKTI